MTFIDKTDGFYDGYMAGVARGRRDYWMDSARRRPDIRSYSVGIARSYSREFLMYCRRAREAEARKQKRLESIT